MFLELALVVVSTFLLSSSTSASSLYQFFLYLKFFESVEMRNLAFIPSIAALASQVPMAEPAETTTTIPFSSTFHQPAPPLVKPAFKAHWSQHKWNANVSHIASGYMYSSPSVKKVRVDEAYDGTLGSSLFDYNKVTDEGVYNIVWTLSPSLTSAPEFFTGYVEGPAFPLVEEGLLVSSNAVYAGVTSDPDFGELTKVFLPLRSRDCSRQNVKTSD